MWATYGSGFICEWPGKRSGVRAFAEPLNLDEIRQHAWVLSSEALGRGAIEKVVVEEVAEDDSAVVALILSNHQKHKAAPRSDGEHPIAEEMQRSQPRQLICC
jgi:hypothetical protein